MKTKKELLQLLLNYIVNYNSVDDYEICGLCSTTYDLFMDRLIDRDEFGTIIDYIKENRPNNLRTIANSITILHISYYWKKGKIKPRIKWLKKHINKLSKVTVFNLK